jgi:hypothetical protein
MDFLFVFGCLMAAIFLVASVIVLFLAAVGLIDLDDHPSEPDPGCRCAAVLPCQLHPWRFDWRATRPPGALRKLGK